MTNRGGSLAIGTAVARGSTSLHVQTQGNGHAYIALDRSAPPDGFFARRYVQVPTASNAAHFTLVEASAKRAGLIRPSGGQDIPNMGTLSGAGSGGGPLPRFNNPWLGGQLHRSGSTPNPFNLWYDDIVSSTRRVGC